MYPVGGFAAFQDLAYGATGPLGSVLAGRTGHASIFLIGGLAAISGLPPVISDRQAQDTV